MPASENITSSMMNAHHGERWFKPLKSSIRSDSNPARDKSMINPNDTRLVST